MSAKRLLLTAALIAATGFAASPVSARPATPQLGSETITPSSNLVNKQKVHLHVTGFGKFTGKVSAIQCTTQALVAANPTPQCDGHKKHLVVKKMKHGSINLSFHVLSKSFHAPSKSAKCTKGGTCIIVVSAHPLTNPPYAAFAQIHFKG